MLTMAKRLNYNNSSKTRTGGIPAPLDADIFISKNASNGKNTPVSRIREVRGAYPVMGFTNTGAFLSSKQKSLQIINWRRAMPNNSNQSFSNFQSIVQQFQSIQLIVTPDKTHDFLMTTENVAKGYGVSMNSIHNHKQRQSSEILENTHFLSDTQIVGLKNGMTKKRILWTKRGVIRLGMFIKSQRAIKFRDWAENLIIDNLDGKKAKPALPSKAVELFSDDWEETSNTGVYIYKRGVSNALLLPTSRFRNPDEFATEEAIEGFIREDIAKLQYALKTQAWLNAFDGYGIKVYSNGQKVYSTVVAGEYISKKLKMIK